MRASAAIVIFATWPCFIQTRYSSVNRDTSAKKETIDESVFNSVQKCALKLGIPKCVAAFGTWEVDKSLHSKEMPTIYRENFPWQYFDSISTEELNDRLCNRTLQLLQDRSLKMNLFQEYSIQLDSQENGFLSVDVLKKDAKESARTSMKKLYKHFYDFMPFLLVPGLIISAVLPFFLPTLKMMTLAAGMLNNMALTGAVFTLLRNNAFNDKYHHKVIYINDGYINDGYHDKYEPLGDTQSPIVVDPNFDGNFADFENYKIKDFTNNKPVSGYEVNPDWLKQLTGKLANPAQMFQNAFGGQNWRKKDSGEKQN